jgi:hypothetical protein
MAGSEPVLNEGPRLLAFVCDEDSRILSSATMKGNCFDLAEGRRLLDFVSDSDTTSPEEHWIELVTSGFSIHAEVHVNLATGSPPQLMLFHAMALLLVRTKESSSSLCVPGFGLFRLARMKSPTAVQF